MLYLREVYSHQTDYSAWKPTHGSTRVEFGLTRFTRGQLNDARRTALARRLGLAPRASYWLVPSHAERAHGVR